MSSTDTMSSFFAQPRGTAGQLQSTDSIRPTQMRFPQMSQGLGMGSGAGTGTVPRTTSGTSTGTTQQQTDVPSMPGIDSMRQPGTFPGTTQQQTDVPSMPGMDSMRQPGTFPRTTQQQTEVPSMPGMDSMRQPGSLPMTTQQQTDVPSMPGMDSMRQPGTFPRTTQQQTEVPSMPGMDSMRQPGSLPMTTQQQTGIPYMSAPEPQYPELLQLSFQEALAKNIGEFVIVEFLIGTNLIEKKQGILYNVGLSYIILFEEQSKTFIICDLYCIKFITFYLPGQKPTQQPTGGQNMRGR